MARNFEVGKTVTTDKLQVHTVTHKVDLKNNRHAKTFFAASTLEFVAAHMSVRLNWETFVSAAKFTQQRFVVSPGLDGGLEKPN